MNIPPPSRSKPIRVRASNRSGTKEIHVFGQRDPRGPDNNIYIWVDEQDRLHIRLLKTERCYKFDQLIDNGSTVEIIAK